MRHAKRAAAAVARAEEPSARAAVLPALPALAALRLASVDEERRTAMVGTGGLTFEARLDDSLSPAVLVTALSRGEPVIAQREATGWVVLGALRTAPTPGVDEGDEYRIKARRIALESAHELSLVSGAASLVLRAYGHVETLAEDITSRAAGVHKVIGRLLRLN
jgi:hypothetical protein